MPGSTDSFFIMKMKPFKAGIMQTFTPWIDP